MTALGVGRGESFTKTHTHKKKKQKNISNQTVLLRQFSPRLSIRLLFPSSPVQSFLDLLATVFWCPIRAGTCMYVWMHVRNGRARAGMENRLLTWELFLWSLNCTTVQIERDATQRLCHLDMNHLALNSVFVQVVMNLVMRCSRVYSWLGRHISGALFRILHGRQNTATRQPAPWLPSP